MKQYIIRFDVLGKEVSVPVNEQEKPEKYEIKLVADNLSSGIYIY